MESVAPATENSSTSTAEETSATAETNNRGNVEKKIGEEAGITSKDGKSVYTFKVTSIEPDYQCTREYSRPAENGHIVKVNLEVVTADAKTMKDAFHSSGVSFDPYSWKYIAANGTTFNGNLGSIGTISCLEESEELPINIGPGEKVTGSVVLDVPATDGTLVYKDILADGGWEYKIQQ